MKKGGGYGHVPFMIRSPYRTGRPTHSITAWASHPLVCTKGSSNPAREERTASNPFHIYDIVWKRARAEDDPLISPRDTESSAHEIRHHYPDTKENFSSRSEAARTGYDDHGSHYIDDGAAAGWDRWALNSQERGLALIHIYDEACSSCAHTHRR